jgi:hypothetical protein
MRVISQDGTIDMPYDYFSLSMSWAKIASGKVEDRNVFSIVCHNLSSPNGTKLAEYSTEEKAKKAMEMLREKYLTRMELDGGFDHVNKVYVQPNYWVLPKVFQFPAEEELE